MPPILGSIISAGAGIVGNAFNNYAVRRNNEYQTQLWREQMEYNSPKAQMQRFKEAGLNPHLIYSQGNSGNVGNAPSTQAQSVDLTQIANVISTYLDLKQKDRNIESTDQEIRKKGNENDAFEKDEPGRLRKRINDQWAIDGPDSIPTDPDTGAEYPDNVDVKDWKQNFEQRKKIYEALEQDISGKKIKQALDELQLGIGYDMKFITEENRRRWKEYGILPEDPDFLKIVKVGTRMLGMNDSDLMNFIVKFGSAFLK